MRVAQKHSFLRQFSCTTPRCNNNWPRVAWDVDTIKVGVIKRKRRRRTLNDGRCDDDGVGDRAAGRTGNNFISRVFYPATDRPQYGGVLLPDYCLDCEQVAEKMVVICIL